jgi:hypothetical protein
MLQVLHLDILKVDQVLYLSPHLLLPHLGVSSPLGDGDVWGGAGPA